MASCGGIRQHPVEKVSGSRWLLGRGQAHGRAFVPSLTPEDEGLTRFCIEGDWGFEWHIITGWSRGLLAQAIYQGAWPDSGRSVNAGYGSETRAER